MARYLPLATSASAVATYTFKVARVKGRVFAGAATAALVTLLSVSPAHALTTISQGHVDAVDVDWTGSALTLDLRDGTVTPNVDRNPADVVLNAVSASKTTVPSGTAYSFLGTPGSAVWILPQTQVSSIVWPGFNTEGVPSGALQGNTAQREAGLGQRTG